MTRRTKDPVGLSTRPFGPEALAAARAILTSSSPSPIDARAAGSTCTRTAGFSDPLTVTWPTPWICESCCARIVSAASYTGPDGNASEVSARINTGEADGLFLRQVGGWDMPEGRSLEAALIAACTSRAAASIERLRSNWTMIAVRPGRLVLVSSVTLAICPRRRSSGAATVAAIVLGSAPGSAPVTTIVG